MPVHLRDLPKGPSSPSLDRAPKLRAFLREPTIAALGWPDEVVEQWLFDHGQNARFLKDYGGLDLSRIKWALERVAASEFATMPTGPSDGDYMLEVARDHAHYLKRNRQGRPNVVEAWERAGTWVVPPILMSRALLRPPGDGLQAVEGRTRIGILRGRRADLLWVADEHVAWVGRGAEAI